MLCPTCHGHRLFFYHGRLIPCPDCEGQGDIHCCDGLREQPEDETSPPEETGDQEHQPDA